MNVDAKRDRARPRLRWFQFSLRGLFIVMTLFAVWLGFYVDRSRKQEEALKALRHLRGYVQYDYVVAAASRGGEPTPPGPAWLRDAIGIDFLADVSEVGLFHPLYDSDLEHLEALHHLETLRIYGPEITDAGLAHLEGLDDLTDLALVCPKVTDGGLAHLRGLRELRTLRIASSATAAGVQHLAPLRKLETLVYLDSRGDPWKTQLAVESLDSLAWIECINVPLPGVMDYLTDFHGCAFSIDKRALEAAHISSESPVSLSFTRAPLRSALRSLLDPLGLDWTIAGEGLLITTKEAASAERARIAELRQTWPRLKVYVDQGAVNPTRSARQ